MADEEIKGRPDEIAPATENARPDAATTEAATGAESTYIHGGQRILENPPPSGAPDVSPPVAEVLNEMHVDSKLSSAETAVPPDARAPVTAAPVAQPLPAGPGATVTTAPTAAPGTPGMVGQNANGEPVDQYGRTQADLDKLAQQREEANKALDDQVKARETHAQAVTDANTAARDRSMAVQEEVGTRERDGATIGTPAFERRKATVAAILDKTTPATDPAVRDDRPAADRLSELAASMHLASPSGLETIQHQIMALAAEMRGGNKSAA